MSTTQNPLHDLFDNILQEHDNAKHLVTKLRVDFGNILTTIDLLQKVSSTDTNVDTILLRLHHIKDSYQKTLNTYHQTLQTSNVKLAMLEEVVNNYE